MDSGNSSVGVQFAVVDGEDQLEIRAGCEDGAGLDVAAAHADIDQIPKDRGGLSFRVQFNGDAAFHPGIETADLSGRLLLFLDVHAAIGLCEKTFRILSIGRIDGLAYT